MSSLNGSLCLWLFINVLNIYCDSLEGQINKAIVQTTGGLVLGETWGKNWYRFRGIPFAEPPIGDLRFEVSYKFELNSIKYSINITSKGFFQI